MATAPRPSHLLDLALRGYVLRCDSGVFGGAGVGVVMLYETFDQAVARTGRKWPYRTEDWPCPACWKAECDQDIEMTWKGMVRGVWTFVYQHAPISRE